MNYPYQFPNMMPMHPMNADFHTHGYMPQQPTLVDPRSRTNVPSFTHLSPDAWNHLEAMNHPPYLPIMNHHSFGNPYMNTPFSWPATYTSPQQPVKCPLGLREDLLSRLPRLRLLPLGQRPRILDLELDPFPRGARRASSSEELPPEEPGGLLRSVCLCVCICV